MLRAMPMHALRRATPLALAVALAATLAPALAVALAATLAPALATAKSKPKVPRTPQVKIVGFSTYPRLGIPPIQAKPGKTITACQDGYNGQREVNVVWQGWGIPKGTKMGIALWGGPYDTGMTAEPTDADTMKTNGFKWSHRKQDKVQSPYGFTFAGGPYGPQDIDGTWTAKVLIKGKVVARKQVTIACA
jgi:hypothetical protein